MGETASILQAHRLAPLLLAVASAGCCAACCGSDEPEALAGGPGGAVGGGQGVALPPECEGENPFTAEDCGRALMTICRAQPTEQACAAQGPFSFSDGEYVFLCDWARVVTFSDPDTCTVASVTGRCEAGIVQTVGCLDPCDEEGGMGLYNSLRAIASESELIELGCVADFQFSGPVGAWTALSNQQGDERYTSPCGADLPPPPSLCACHSVACDAE